MNGTGLVLTIGETSEHVNTSLQFYSPDKLILLTSEKFASKTRRRLSHWKKQFNLEGEVFVIEDLFGKDAAYHIMDKTFKAIHSLHDQEYKPVLVGITGGTMHMAAAVSTAANISYAPVFYVKQPSGTEVVQPNKDVIEMPTLTAFNKIMLMPTEALQLFSRVAEAVAEGEDVNLSLSDAKDINMPVEFLDHLTEIRVMEKLSKTEYVFTNAGSVIVQIIAKNPNIAKMLESKKKKSEAPDHLYA
tara:strand:- start:25044 stop:25778 length:735 start_codon:yes stop_codon:yes gene_type:complete